MNNEDISASRVRDFAGKNDFVWWIGYVEDRKDPLKLGRVRVRCFGWHADNKVKLPTEDLPWALVSLSPNLQDPYALWEGSLVFGFFMDSENGQEPVVVGVLSNIPLKSANPKEAFNDPRTDSELSTAPRPPKSKQYRKDGSGIKITEMDKASRHPRNLDEPTTPRMARNDSESITKTFIQERKDNVVTGVPTVSGSWSEPKTKYDARYPYNNVTETESGHILEFDDTYGKERIQLAHRNGSFQEWFPEGDKVEKITKDNYQIVMGDDRVYIMGKCQVTIQGDAELRIQGDYDVLIDGECNVESKGNMKFVAPRIDWNP